MTFTQAFLFLFIFIYTIRYLFILILILMLHEGRREFGSMFSIYSIVSIIRDEF